MRLAVALLLCSWSYTTCYGQTDVSAEPGIAVNGQPLPVARTEDGHKLYQYYFHDQEILSISVINNETYQLTDCYEDSHEPCWLPRGHKFRMEWPKRTFCCTARHSDPARTTRLSVTTRLQDDNVAEIRMMVIKYRKHCEADTQVVGRALRVTLQPARSSDIIYSLRCRAIVTTDYSAEHIIESRNFTKDSSGHFITFLNSTLNKKGKWKLKCTYFTIPCVYSDYNSDMSDKGPGCWFRRGYYIEEDQGVSCDIDVNVISREDVVPPAGQLAAPGAQFSTARTSAYYFTEGQQASFHCNRTVDGFAQLTYTDKAGNITSTKFHQQGLVMLSLNLTAAANDDTFLECTIADVMYEEYLRIRVRLLAKPEDLEDTESMQNYP